MWISGPWQLGDADDLLQSRGPPIMACFGRSQQGLSKVDALFFSGWGVRIARPGFSS